MAERIERPRGGVLPERHEATKYAHAKVCRRCGQDWPCTFARGVPISDRWVDEEPVTLAFLEEPPLPPDERVRLAWSARTAMVCQS